MRRPLGLVVTVLLGVGLLALPTTAQATPTQTSPPTISGNPVVGSTLTGGTGSWQSNGRSPDVTYSARYFEGCQGRTCDIVAREATTYVLTSADVGKSFHYCVVVSDGIDPTASDCSSYTAAVTDPAPSPPPKARGTASSSWRIYRLVRWSLGTRRGSTPAG